MVHQTELSELSWAERDLHVKCEVKPIYHYVAREPVGERTSGGVW